MKTPKTTVDTSGLGLMGLKEPQGHWAFLDLGLPWPFKVARPRSAPMELKD